MRVQQVFQHGYHSKTFYLHALSYIRFFGIHKIIFLKYPHLMHTALFSGKQGQMKQFGSPLIIHSIPNKQGNGRYVLHREKYRRP